MSPSSIGINCTIAAAKRGSREALGDLLERHGVRLTRRVRGLLGARLAVKIGPADVVQEALMTASFKFPGFKGKTEKEFEHWLARILHRRVLDTRKYFHAAKRDVRRERPLTGSDVNRPARNETESPAHGEANAELCLRDLLTDLPIVYRRVVNLSFTGQKSDGDIARIMKRSIDAVRKLRLRALRMLGRKLDVLASIGPAV